jgi:hypothetical protein
MYYGMSQPDNEGNENCRLEYIYYPNVFPSEISGSQGGE